MTSRKLFDSSKNYRKFNARSTAEILLFTRNPQTTTSSTSEQVALKYIIIYVSHKIAGFRLRQTTRSFCICQSSCDRFLHFRNFFADCGVVVVVGCCCCSSETGASAAALSLSLMAAARESHTVDHHSNPKSIRAPQLRRRCEFRCCLDRCCFRRLSITTAATTIISVTATTATIIVVGPLLPLFGIIILPTIDRIDSNITDVALSHSMGQQQQHKRSSLLIPRTAHFLSSGTRDNDPINFLSLIPIVVNPLFFLCVGDRCQTVTKEGNLCATVYIDRNNSDQLINHPFDCPHKPPPRTEKRYGNDA